MPEFSCRASALLPALVAAADPPIQVPTEKLLVPDVCYQDFVEALKKSGSSVSADELTRFIQWTEEFGQEG